MTKEITKAIILQEMQDKFALREFEPSNFLFDETVVPVYEIRGHLQIWRSNRITVSITAATNFLVTQVPMNERWTLRAYSITFASGAFTIAGIYIRRNACDSANDFSYLDLKAAQDTAYLVSLNPPVTLEPLDNIRVNADGYTTTGNIYVHMDYMKEEIR